jgi:hypothetical protein
LTLDFHKVADRRVAVNHGACPYHDPISDLGFLANQDVMAALGIVSGLHIPVNNCKHPDVGLVAHSSRPANLPIFQPYDCGLLDQTVNARLRKMVRIPHISTRCPPFSGRKPAARRNRPQRRHRRLNSRWDAMSGSRRIADDRVTSEPASACLVGSVASRPQGVP